MEARVFARYRASDHEVPSVEDEPIVVRGTLRGPFCENASTLPAEFTFRDSGKGELAEAEVVVPDPCLWSPELPHVYHVDVDAVQGNRVIATYRGPVGLRRLTPRRPVDFAPGTG